MQKDLQQKYVELQMLNQQIKQVHEQFMFLQQQLSELTNLEININEMNDIKKDSEIFSSLGPGIFVTSKLTNSASVLVNVGSGILVEKSLQEAIGLIKFQAKNVTESLEAIKEQLNTSISYSQKLENEMNVLAQKENK